MGPIRNLKTIHPDCHVSCTSLCDAFSGPQPKLGALIIQGAKQGRLPSLISLLRSFNRFWLSAKNREWDSVREESKDFMLMTPSDVE
jgi:hypothetical protein